MSPNRAAEIKSKLQELSALIAEEAAEESRELKSEIIESINELKAKLEKSPATANQKPEQTFLSDVKDDVNLIVEKTHIKDFLKDVKDDAETIVEETHIKDFVEDAKDDVETIIDSTYIDKFLKDAKGDLNTIIKDLEYRALKAQYAIQEKFSNSKNKKDEAVINTADSLVEAVNKVKCALAECEKED